MRHNILIAGAAGQGINEISNILSKSLAFAGYYIFNYREYGSLIAGGHNFNVLSFSDEKINSHENDYDIVIALNEDVFSRYKFSKNAIVLASQNFKNAIKIEIENQKIENVYYAAALFKILGLDKEILRKYIQKIFAGKSLLQEDLVAVEKAYSKDYGINLNYKNLGRNNLVFNGAEITGIAAIEAGLQIYLAYPMTPATSLLTFLAQKQKEYGFLVYQPENEISVVNQALGASFSHALTMIGTSGGGFDLMTEALSMQGISEIPLVVYLAQRPGPSTGVPTYSGQGDINVALYGGHGEFPRIVVCPGDLQDSYRLTKEIFYLSEKYNALGIILSDKHLAESSYSIEKLKEISMPYKVKKIVGKEIFKTSSYEHDEKGNTIEDAEKINERFELRLDKQEAIKKEVSKFKMFEIYGNKNSKNILVSTGSNKGAIIDSLRSLKNFKFIHINYLEPFPNISNEIGKDFFVLESNSTGMLADLIQKNLCLKVPKDKRILKYDGRPWTASEIVERLK